MITDDLARLGAGDLLADLLPTDASIPPAEQPHRIEGDEATELVELCLNLRLGPILAEAVHSGHFLLPDPAQQALREGAGHSLAAQLTVEREALPVLDALAEANVEVRVLKGISTAHLDYPNPAMRPSGDLDLLIDPTQISRTMDALAALDGGEFQTIPRGDWRVTHAIPFERGGVEFDIHIRLLHQAAGHCADHLDLFGDGQPFEIAGRTLFGLPPWLRLIQAASQNVIGGSRQLTSDLDVARLAGHSEEALERATRVGLAWVVSEGIRQSQESLRWGQPIARHRPLTWRDRWFKRLYDDGGKRSVFERSAFELVTAKPTIAAAIVRGAVQPGDAYLERRGRSRSEQIKRQVDRIRHLGR